MFFKDSRKFDSYQEILGGFTICGNDRDGFEIRRLSDQHLIARVVNRESLDSAIRIFSLKSD